MLEIKVILTADQALLGALTAFGGVAAKADEGSAPAETEQVPGQIAMDLDPLTAKVDKVSTPSPAPVPVPVVPVSEVTYTQDQLAVAATTLMDTGRNLELRGLLQQFGVQALSQLPKSQYGAFATALRAKGVKI